MPHRILLKTGLPESIVNALCVAGRFASHVSVGTVGGAAVTGAENWAHPYAIFIGASAIIQLFIKLLSMFFSERRDLLATLERTITAQAAEHKQEKEQQANFYKQIIDEERKSHEAYRHALVNNITALINENNLLRKGAESDTVPPVRLIYNPSPPTDNAPDASALPEKPAE